MERSRAQREAGFTLVEIAIIVLVLAILTAIMLPQLGNFNRLARKVKVGEDVGALCAVLKVMLDETFLSAFWADPQTRRFRIGLLAGKPGGIPAVSPVLTGSNPGARAWAMAVPAAMTFQVSADALDDGSAVTGLERASSAEFFPDTLQNHLQLNSPLFGSGGVAQGIGLHNESYPTIRNTAWRGMAWRGPYFDMISTDPWGNRYACNVFALHTTDAGDAYTSPVVCLSAGANEVIDTPFNMAYKLTPNDLAGGYQTGIDDVACVLSAGGPF